MTGRFQVGWAAREDLDAILAIANWAAAHTTANFALEPEPIALWEEAWARTAGSHPWLVARCPDDRAIVGFAKAGPHRSRRAYDWMVETTVYVQPDQHGKGIGRALYARLLAILRAQGYVTAIAGITSPNPPSERLHAAFGFTRCGTFHRAGWKYGAWHDVGYWELSLQPEGAPAGPLRPIVEILQEETPDVALVSGS